MKKMEEKEIMKIRSFIYDYKLRSGQWAHKPFQILEPMGAPFSDREIIGNIIQYVPDVIPVVIHEIKQKVTMSQLQQCAEGGRELPSRPICLNPVEVRKAVKEYKTTKGRRSN